MIPIRKEEWPSIREQGKTHFIIHYGILRIGVAFALGLSFLRLMWGNDFTFAYLKSYLSHEWFWILFRCLFFGISIGWLEWLKNEASFVKRGGRI